MTEEDLGLSPGSWDPAPDCAWMHPWIQGAAGKSECWHRLLPLFIQV